MLERTKGIVLHSLKYSDTSIIVKIYTESFGLVSYLVRSSKNKNTINITLGNGEMIFISGNTIGNKLSNRIFQRSGDVVRIEVLFEDFARNTI